MKITFTSTVVKHFVDFVFNKIISEFGWEKLESYLSVGGSPNQKTMRIDALNIKFGNLFYISDKPATKEELSKGGDIRFNLAPIFESNNIFCYLNSEWGLESPKLSLRLIDLEKFVNLEFGEVFNINVEGTSISKSFIFTETLNRDFAVISKPKINKASGLAINKIYFGCPGTGKSFQLKEDTKTHKRFETTFHPEYDYAAFVGSYKPKAEGEKITYAFTPQIFINAFMYAFSHPTEDVVLSIEEINRGNCAMIFGDIFQLLDRKEDGQSEYVVTPDADLNDYLMFNLEKFNGELRLPNNLSILATMNTSDQSLFPMDSAFKRRWEWEYVPIDLDKAKEMTFTVNKKMYNWKEFLKVVNEKIYNVTKSEDKQMGTFFVSGQKLISAQQFKNKVMYYLWFDIFKNEEPTDKDYIFKYIKDDKEFPFTFSDLFKDKDDALLESFLTRLGLKPSENTTETV
jgi:hypothetical protein